MKRLTLRKPGIRTCAILVILSGWIGLASLNAVKAADAKTEKPAKAEKPAAKKTDKKKLSGGDLYAIHCNRCHPERYATERTSGQWKTLMQHMRVRANLPAEEAKAILKYLQEDSGK